MLYTAVVFLFVMIMLLTVLNFASQLINRRSRSKIYKFLQSAGWWPASWTNG